MTNLTDKIATVTDRLDTVTDRLDTVITKLETSNTKLTDIAAALTGASGNIDATPIVAAIEALRGAGPENTVKSINQSLWNLAGPAPGYTLTDLYTVLAALKTNVGIPTGDATTTLLGLLASVQYAVANDATNTLYYVIREIMRTLTLPGTIDRSILQELDLIRLAANTTNDNLNPPSVPSDACVDAYVSRGIATYSLAAGIPFFNLLGTHTMATWGGTPPTGITIDTSVADRYVLSSADWSQYRIYVSSLSSIFKIASTATQSFATNKWITLAGSGDFVFCVDGVEKLTVTICVIGATNPSTYEATTITCNGTPEYAIVWPAEIDAMSDLGGYTRSDRAYRVGDFYGWRVRATVGACGMDMWDSIWAGNHAINETEWTITTHTTHVNFYASSVFSIEMLLPI